MNKQKLYNIIRKKIDNRYFKTSATIKKQKFSFKLLKSLFDDYKLTEWVVSNYCCYGEDRCCWFDENTCWWSDSVKNSPVRQYNGIKRYINQTLKPEQIKKWNIFITTTDDYILLDLPMRFTSTEDMALVFEKK